MARGGEQERRGDRLRAQWWERLRRFKKREGTVAAFCEAESVSAWSLYDWRRKLMAEADSAGAVVRRCRAAHRARRRDGAADSQALMFFPEGQVRVFVYGAPVNLRLSFDGLYALTKSKLGLDPLLCGEQ